MAVHDLKIIPNEFEAVKNGSKRFEFRVNSENYAIGDLLHLCEFKPQLNQYTGRELTVKVLHIKPGSDDPVHISAKHVIMSISDPIQDK